MTFSVRFSAVKNVLVNLCVMVAAAVLLLGAVLPVPACADGQKLQIVTTIFPVYDWIRVILEGQESRADITMLLDSGADLHNYQPTARDILTIKQADLFIYIGGESERGATYILNFFKCQPALNYGFLKPQESWQLHDCHGVSSLHKEHTARAKKIADLVKKL